MTRRKVRLSQCLSLTALAAGSMIWAAQLAQAKPAWSPPRDIFSTEVSSILPDDAHRKLALEVRADAAGNAVAAWLQKVGSSCQAKWATRPVGGDWGTPQTFAGPPGACPLTAGGLSLAMNKSGAAVAAWLDGADVWAAVRSSGGAFGSAIQLSTGLTNSPTASINGQGKSAVGWVLQSANFGSPSPFQARIRPAGGAFTPAETVTPPGASAAAFTPRIAVGPGGDVVAAWVRTYAPTLNSTGVTIDTAYRTAGGTFPSAPTQTLDNFAYRTGAVTDYAPDVAFDALGRATIAWVHDTGSLLQVQSAAKVTGADTFGGSQTVNVADSGNARAPRVAVDAPTNTAVVAWLQCSGSCAVHASVRPDGGVFGSVKTLSGTLTSDPLAPVVGFASDGAAVAAWTEKGSAVDEVMVSRRPKGGAFGSKHVISGQPAASAQDRGPALGFDGAGNVLAAWAHLSSTPGAVLRYADFLTSYYQPDALIKKASASTYTGGKIYNSSALHQSVTASVQRGHAMTFDIKLVNRSSTRDTFTVKGPGAESGFAVRYLAGTSGTTTITTAVVNGTYSLAGIAPGASRTFRLVVTVNQGTAVGASANWLLFATSSHDTTRKDAVNAIVKVVS